MKLILGEELWKLGEFGLWSFLKESVINQEKEPSNDKLLNSSDLRAFILPLGPNYN